MKSPSIHYNQKFETAFRRLPRHIQEKAVKAEEQFRHNPFHPSLKTHKLSGKLEGYWSISIDRKYRIIFEPLEDGNILFISCGTHAIYN